MKVGDNRYNICPKIEKCFYSQNKAGIIAYNPPKFVFLTKVPDTDLTRVYC